MSRIRYKCPFCEKHSMRLAKSRSTPRSRRRTYICQNPRCGKTDYTLEVREIEMSHRLVKSLRYDQNPPQFQQK